MKISWLFIPNFHIHCDSIINFSLKVQKDVSRTDRSSEENFCYLINKKKTHMSSRIEIPFSSESKFFQVPKPTLKRIFKKQ